jgi:hypothetical protein
MDRHLRENMVIILHINYTQVRAFVRNIFVSAIAAFVLLLNTSFINLRSDKITFTGYFGTQQLMSGKNYYSASRGDSISVDMLRFYVSKVEILQNGHVWGQADYKLIDVFDTASNFLGVDYYGLGPMTELRFYLGIDSTTNMAGVGKNDLDPTKGMYWTWQSGYINLKLEGASKLCKSNRGKYQYHIGGYSYPANALRTVVLKVDRYTGEFNVAVDVEQFFANVDMKETTHVMSPSLKSQGLADQAVKMFSLK